MRALVAALVTTAVLPVASATAQSPAERFPADGADMFRAISIAAAYWNERPCGGRVELRWGSLAFGTRAEANWQNYVDPWTNPAENFACSITFNTGMPFAWPDLCTTMVHEVGHLLGRQHSADPHSIMSEHAIDPIPVCGGTTPSVAREATVRAVRTARSTRRRCLRRSASLRGARTFGDRRTCRRRASRLAR